MTKRNIDRFPKDFMFELTAEEFEIRIDTIHYYSFDSRLL